MNWIKHTQTNTHLCSFSGSVKNWICSLSEQMSWLILRYSRIGLNYILVLSSHPLPQAYVVLGQFLVLKKDEELFRDWLKDTCGANVKQQGDCYGCLKEWCDAFL